ncbi:MAG: hypothetical protein KC925_01525 [Candidatus Doudnabacteria bacterium]|nr:hypothetical protein [Candidatus Doudnabacteria bacterium]
MGKFSELVAANLMLLRTGVDTVIGGSLDAVRVAEIKRAILVNALIVQLDDEDLEELQAGYEQIGGQLTEAMRGASGRGSQYAENLKQLLDVLDTARTRITQRLRSLTNGLRDGDVVTIKWVAKGPDQLDELVSCWVETTRGGIRLQMQNGSEELPLSLSRAVTKEVLRAIVVGMAARDGLRVGELRTGGDDQRPTFGFTLYLPKK